MYPRPTDFFCGGYDGAEGYREDGDGVYGDSTDVEGSLERCESDCAAIYAPFAE